MKSAVLIAFVVGGVLIAAPPQKTPPESLMPLAGLVGDWRGVAQPKRGSSAGAWRETLAAEWAFPKDAAPHLLATVTDGQMVETVTFASGDDSTLLATLVGPDGERQLTGSKKGNAYVFDETGGAESLRLTLRLLNEKRTTLLLEEKSGTRHLRLAEVGYTRAGEKLADGDGGVKCIVTGGRGTIAVSHAGKTYYVCCNGCLQAFRDDPEAYITAAKSPAE